MSANQADKTASSAPPPPPPPPPRPFPPNFKFSPFVLKLRSAPPDWYYEPKIPPPFNDPFAAPTGPYFFYGTLSDPAMLRDVLELDSKPELRTASMIGYKCKMWGQYPALVDAPNEVVHGYVYDVETREHAERLAAYETSNYRVDPCCITYTDGKEPVECYGNTFMFDGNVQDLSEGSFDLGVWLRRMKRGGSDRNEAG
ncbi:hypothetical protein BJX99DRAFT_127592 [Aspergillus californicus]